MQNKPLSQLADVHYGKSPNDIRTYSSNINIYGTGGFIGHASKPLFQKDGVIVGRKGTLGNPIYATGEYWVIDTAYAVIPNAEIDSKWLYYNLSNYNLESLNEATGVPSINRDLLYRIEFNTPNYSEQQKIAEILSTVDEEIEQTEALIGKYEMIKQGMMQDLFTRGVDKSGKLRPRYEDAPELYKESPLGMIPKEWEAKRLSELYACPSRSGLYKEKEFYGHGYPMVHMPQMFRGLTVDVSDAVRVNVDNSEISRFGLQDGDLLFARRSLTLEGAGKCTVVDTINEITTFESSIIRVRVNIELYNPFFINQFLNTMEGYLIRLPFIRQVAVSGVSSEDVANFIVLCPQRTEQDAIILMIEQYDVLIKNEKNQKLKLIKIKQGLMQDLLSGEVRVAV